MKKYQYKAVLPDELALAKPGETAKGIDLLNELGEEGWLLVRVAVDFKKEEWILVREREG